MPSTISLPFSLAAVGGSVRSDQVWGGNPSDLPNTHVNRSYYSIDFSLPLNTPVISIGNGVVVNLTQNLASGVAGASLFGNYITIRYDSLGIFATYAHLATDSMGTLATGQLVYGGQVLGRVGDAGYGIHLHFQVGSIAAGTYGINGTFANGSSSSSVPVYFDTATGMLRDGVISQISVDLASASGRTSDQNNVTLLGTSNINGWGDSLSNIISGNSGRNFLDGRGGDDTLIAGSGNDTLVGGSGNDILNGGAGLDTADYTNDTAPITASLVLQGNYQATGGAGFDLLLNIENLTGSQFSDRLTGNGDSNVLNGQAGNDTLIGGLGKDTLTGGVGNDLFIYSSITESGVGSASRDTITDFRPGDILDLSAIDANSLIPFNQQFSIVSSQIASLLPATLWFSNGVLYGNVNGGAPDFEIGFSGLASLPVNSIIR